MRHGRGCNFRWAAHEEIGDAEDGGLLGSFEAEAAIEGDVFGAVGFEVARTAGLVELLAIAVHELMADVARKESTWKPGRHPAPVSLLSRVLPLVFSRVDFDDVFGVGRWSLSACVTEEPAEWCWQFSAGLTRKPCLA